jgi:PST family polysaccharide transporter
MFDLMATYLVAVGATRSVLVVQIWWLVVMVPAMWIGVRNFGLPGAGFTHLAVGLAAVLPAYLFCLHRVGVDWLSFVRAWILPTLSIIPAGAACFWVANGIESSLGALALSALCALTLYALPLAPWWLRRVRSLRNTDQRPLSQAL